MTLNYLLKNHYLLQTRQSIQRDEDAIDKISEIVRRCLLRDFRWFEQRSSYTLVQIFETSNDHAISIKNIFNQKCEQKFHISKWYTHATCARVTKRAI